MTRSDGLTKVIPQGTVEGRRRRSRPNKRWTDNITEWTGESFTETQAMAHNRQEWIELMRMSVMPRPYGKARQKYHYEKEWLYQSNCPDVCGCAAYSMIL